MFEVSLRGLYKELVKLPPEERTLSSILNGIYMHHAALQKPSASRWGDKTPGNAFCLDRLLMVFPGMKVVHLIRDGRDVVRSFTEMEGGLSFDDAAERWVSAIHSIREFDRSHANTCIEVRYEDLVRDPQREVRRVCDFIQLDFGPDMLRHHEVGSRSADITTYSHYKNVLEPISLKSVGKWKGSMDRGAIEQLNSRLGPLLAELGYS
jgi:hypothetical protein